MRPEAIEVWSFQRMTGEMAGESIVDRLPASPTRTGQRVPLRPDGVWSIRSFPIGVGSIEHPAGASCAGRPCHFMAGEE